MANPVITPELKTRLEEYLSKEPDTDLLSCYLYYLQERHGIGPVAFPQGKTIYQSSDEAIKKLEAEQKLWRETQIRISFEEEAVNEETKKVYICPFCSKVYGDNTHPNPQDAIYDHVGKCKENTERAGGLPVRRLHTSEDPEIIKNYITHHKKPITKTVYSSVITGKLFNSQSAVIADFKKSHLKPMSLTEVQAQNRYEIDEGFLGFIQTHLEESKIASFIEEMSSHDELQPYIQKWMGGEESD